MNRHQDPPGLEQEGAVGTYAPQGESGRETISARLAADLKKAILSLELEPGSELSPAALAIQWGASRSPVRDALMHLADEALVEIIPQSGSRVTRIDLKRLHEERFLRECLELPVLALFIETHGARELALMEEALEGQRAAFATDDMDRFLACDDRFHRILYEGADQLLSWHAIQSHSGHYRRVRKLVLCGGPIAGELLAEHRDILDLLKARDGAAARKHMKDHLSHILIEEEDLSSRYPSWFAPTTAQDLHHWRNT